MIQCHGQCLCDCVRITTLEILKNRLEYDIKFIGTTYQAVCKEQSHEKGYGYMPPKGPQTKVETILLWSVRLSLPDCQVMGQKYGILVYLARASCTIRAVPGSNLGHAKNKNVVFSPRFE